MLGHLRERVTEALSAARTAMLSSHGAAGIQASVVPCESLDVRLYLLVLRTSDHLLNIEKDPDVVVTTETWQLRGRAQVVSELPAGLSLCKRADAGWCEIVAVHPCRLQIEPQGGHGHAETIDVEP